MPNPKQAEPAQISDAVKVAAEVDKTADAFEVAYDQVAKIIFEGLTPVTDTIATIRLEFFNRIVLLDGGTITLSVTLLGFVASKNAHVSLRWPKVLVASWISFVVSMLFALARNWVEHNRLTAVKYVPTLEKALKAVKRFSRTDSVDQLRHEIAERYEETAAREKYLRWQTDSAGIVSLVGMLAGFFLLLMFAAKNVFTI